MNPAIEGFRCTDPGCKRADNDCYRGQCDAHGNLITYAQRQEAKRLEDEAAQQQGKKKKKKKPRKRRRNRDMEEDEEEEAEEDDEIAAEIKGLEAKMAAANAVEKRDLSNRISLLCEKQISLSKDPDGAMDMDDEAKEDMKASRAANEQARRVDLPKLRRIIKDIEGLIPQDGEPDEAQSNMIADSRRKIDAIELETARVASPGKVKQIAREALNKAKSARDTAQGEVNSIDAAILKDEELIEAATNRIRVARERRPAAAAELVTRTAEFDFAQSALDDLAPKRKAPAEVPKAAAQGS